MLKLIESSDKVARLSEAGYAWQRTLAGAPAVLELPTDRRRPAQQDPAGAFVALELDDDLTAGLKALSQRHGTTLFMTLLAGWAALLARLSGQDDDWHSGRQPQPGRGRTIDRVFRQHFGVAAGPLREGDGLR